jgi:hypothetical protein
MQVAWFGLLTRAALEGLAEHEKLELIVDRQHTSAGNTTENVGTSTLEQRADTFLGNDLGGGIDRALVLDSFTRSHHHSSSDSIKRIRGDTGTGGDAPTEEEGSKEVVGKGSDQDNGLDGIVHAEVETTVDDDTNDGGHETTVETSNTIGSEGLAVDVDETVELALAALLGTLGIVGKTGTGIVERVDEEKGGGTGSLGQKH